jgi:uncharacterized membrane protein YhaH (DUF805 family)
MGNFWRHTRFLIPMVVLPASVWFGLKGGRDGLHGAETVPQRIAALVQVLYGLAASVSVLALLSRRAWLGGALTVWALTVTLTAVLAPVVWGGAPWSSGAASGAATLLVAALVSWGAMAQCRDMPRTGAASGGPPPAPSA